MIDHRRASITLGSQKFKIFLPKHHTSPYSTLSAGAPGKTKAIAKNGRTMCDEDCQRHHFELVRKDRNSQPNRFRTDPLNTCASFCSSYDW